MMMKKILILFLALNFINLAARADNTNFGISLTAGFMDATGSHTTNQSTTVNESNSAEFPFASLFLERQIQTGGIDVALGLDVIPVEWEIDSIGGGTGFDATLKIGNLVTAYIQPMIVRDNVSFFARIGYSQADLEITDFKRQATTAGTASTDTDQSKSLEGPMVGIGFQVNTDLAFVRLMGTHTEFDEITHTNSNSKVLKATPEINALTLSIGRAF